MKPSPIIFAFIGRRGSGKDTAADFITEFFLEEDNNSLITSFAFADSLKSMTHDVLGITPEQSEFLKRNPEIKVINGMDLRFFYNRFGDILKKRFGDRIFTENTLDVIAQTNNAINPDVILVTDVRYPMEKAALTKYSQDQGIEIKFIKMINTKSYGTEREDDGHESESLSDDIHGDITIKADSPDEIKIKIKEIYNAIS